MLFDKSYEMGEHGPGLIDGEIKKIKNTKSDVKIKFHILIGVKFF